MQIQDQQTFFRTILVAQARSAGFPFDDFVHQDDEGRIYALAAALVKELEIKQAKAAIDTIMNLIESRGPIIQEELRQELLDQTVGVSQQNVDQILYTAITTLKNQEELFWDSETNSYNSEP